jgi:hypothetical protein
MIDRSSVHQLVCPVPYMSAVVVDIKAELEVNEMDLAVDSAVGAVRPRKHTGSVMDNAAEGHIAVPH